MNFRTVIDALTKIVTDIINFIPNLVNGFIILLIGYVIARFARWVAGVVLRRLKFDEIVDRAGVTNALRVLGVNTPLSVITAQAVFALLLLSFLITATRLMGLQPVAELFERILAFLPTLIAALIVFLLGGIIAQKIGDMVGVAAVAGGISGGKRLGKIVQYLVSLFVVIIALGIMGMDTALLVTGVTIFIAAFGLAVGLSLGLGARSIVHHVLAGYYIRQRFRAGHTIAVEGVTGEVSSVGGVNTVIATGDGMVVLPNGMLLETTVRSPQAQRPATGPAPEQ